MEEFISFKDIYHHIAIAFAVVLGATWSDMIKDKLSMYTSFKRGLLQTIIISFVLLGILMICYLILFSLQRREDAYLKKLDEDEQPDAFIR